MIYARPHPGGNTREDFVTTQAAFETAAAALRDAIAKLQGSVLHARNYQHLVFPDGAGENDMLRVDILRNHLASIDRIAADIADAAIDR